MHLTMPAAPSSLQPARSLQQTWDDIAEWRYHVRQILWKVLHQEPLTLCQQLYSRRGSSQIPDMLQH
jgi:hypothetical protein